MRLKFIITFICSSLFIVTKAQNIVPNGDFEEYIEIPTVMGEWYNCKYWYNTNNNYEWGAEHGTPDYFHELSTSVANLPNSYFGSILPKSGSAIMGFIAMYEPIIYPSSGNFREYLACEFTERMVVGDTYTVSLWISNGDSLIVNGYKCDGVGICFSENPLKQIGEFYIEVEPQYQFEDELWTTEWKNIKFNFLADSAYSNLTIGNFLNAPNTSSTSMVNSIAAGAYYYIDKVSVEHITVSYDTICYGESIEFTAPLDSSYIWRIKNEPEFVISNEAMLIVEPKKNTSYVFKGDYNIFEKRVIVEGCSFIEMPNVFTPNNDKINDVFKPIQFNNVAASYLRIYNRWGNVVFETNDTFNGWNGELNDNNCTSGYYFWEIKYVDFFEAPFEIRGGVTLIK